MREILGRVLTNFGQVRFAPKAAWLLRGSEMALWANRRMTIYHLRPS
jgi:hypothetical protein